MKKLTPMQWLTYGFGISMAILMVLTLFLPGLAPDTTTTQEIPPTEPPPVPTLPSPLNDFSGISFEQDTLEDTGLFAVGVPTGWERTQATGPQAQGTVNLNNGEQLSVIQVQVEEGPPVASAQELGDLYFTQARLSGSWTNYSNPQELLREVRDDRLIIEFALENFEGQEFFARHASWTDGTWIYTARVVVPRNAIDLLDFLLEPVIASIEPQTQFQDTPVTWNAYYDEASNAILRHPNGWTVTDGGEAGVPTSYALPDGSLLRVEAQDTAIADEDAARAWVEDLRAGITAGSVEAIERNGGTGFSVAYTYTTPDGDEQSGYAVLLNSDDGRLHAATALIPAAGVDLNNAEEQPQYTDLLNALGSFSFITGLNLPEPELPEEIPAAEATPEAEATEDAAASEGEGDDAEATEEAPADDAEATEDPGDEADAEATEESDEE